MKTVGERVRWAREKRGLTQAELDEIADLSSGHVGSVERGTRVVPSVVTLSKLSRALRVDLTWLIQGGKRPDIVVER
jgi:HTH-type transcriptional regulator, cell division transcriptional repressor